jgi:predicted transcriptional regulator
MIRLTELEEKVMDVLWKLGKGFPKSIIEHLPPPVPPYNTVLSTIRKLEKLGYVDFEKFGKMHAYYPVLEKQAYQKSLFTKLFNGLMEGSKEKLLSYFLKEENINVEEIEQIIKEMKNQQK